MRVFVNTKNIVANETIYNVITEMNGVGTVTFLADLPKNAIVVDVLVNGRSLENYCVEEYRDNGNTHRLHYPRDMQFEGQHVAAIYIDETCSGELYNLAFSGEIKSFVVKYINAAIVEI